MRLSSRLLANAASSYARLGAQFVLGVFFTWFVVGRLGVAGFGIVTFATATFSIPMTLSNVLRFGLIRELAAAVASGEPRRVSTSLTSAVVLCVPLAALALLLSAGLAALAWAGVLNTPDEPAGLATALAVLLLAEGVYGALRLIASPYSQALFAAQHVALDNALLGLSRLTYVASAVIVLALWMPDEPLAVQIYGLAVTRVSLQLLDIVIGVILARRMIAGLRFDRSAFDRRELKAILGTVWHSGQVNLLMDLNVRFIAVLINLFLGMTYNGIWQIVIQLGAWSRLLAQALMRGVEPVSAHLQQHRPGMIVDLMQRTIRYQLGTILPMVIWVGIFLHPLVTLWVADRMAGDRHLAAAGISVAEALRLVTVMTSLFLVAQVLRASTAGVERMLYGLGEVRSYSWFAKYGALINVAVASLILWRASTPAAVPVSLVITYLIYYPGVILVAASRRAGLPIGATLRRTLPRPIIAGALMAAAALPARLWLGALSLVELLFLLAGVGGCFALLMYFVVLEPGERGRIRELLPGGGADRRPPAADETIGK